MQPFLREQEGFRDVDLPGRRAPVGDGALPSLRDHADRRADRPGRRADPRARPRLAHRAQHVPGAPRPLLRPDLRRQAVRRRGALRARPARRRGRRPPARRGVRQRPPRARVRGARLGGHGRRLQPGPARRARANAPGIDVRTSRTCARSTSRRAPFDAVTCLFDSIGYPQDNDGVVAALGGHAAHLAPSGALAVEFLHAPALLAHADPVRVRRWELPDGGELLRVSETEHRRGRR